MARIKRIANRYGKVTLASLGGFLMTLGTFLIVLSAATATNAAKASTNGCHQFSTPQPNYICTYVDMYGDGSYVYYDCCHECGFFPATVASDPNYQCTACYDYSGDGIDDTCECCTASTQPTCAGNVTCDGAGICWLTGVYGACGTHTVWCRASGGTACSLCSCKDRATGVNCECRQ